MTQKPKYDQPDADGFFGRFGGSFISATLDRAVEALQAAYRRYRDDPDFIAEFEEVTFSWHTPEFSSRNLMKTGIKDFKKVPKNPASKLIIGKFADNIVIFFIYIAEWIPPFQNTFR